MTNSLTKYLDLKLSSYQCSSILLDFFLFFHCLHATFRNTEPQTTHKKKNKRAELKTRNREIIVIESPCIGKESLETDESRKA